MGKLIRDPLLLAWLALCLVTALSLAIGGGVSGLAASLMVLVIAFAKVGTVMFVFMDLARAPAWLRGAAASWLALVLGILLAIRAGWIG